MDSLLTSQPTRITEQVAVFAAPIILREEGPRLLELAYQLEAMAFDARHNGDPLLAQRHLRRASAAVERAWVAGLEDDEVRALAHRLRAAMGN